MNYNRVILAGRLTRDPELKAAGQTQLCKFGLAVNRVFGSGSARKEEVTFVDVAAWDKAGETIARHLRKGDPILVEGRLRLDAWTTLSGEKRSRLEVVAESFQFAPRGEKVDRAPVPEQDGASTRAPSDPSQLREEEIPF